MQNIKFKNLEQFHKVTYLHIFNYKVQKKTRFRS